MKPAWIRDALIVAGILFGLGFVLHRYAGTNHGRFTWEVAQEARDMAFSVHWSGQGDSLQIVVDTLRSGADDPTADEVRVRANVWLHGVVVAWDERDYVIRAR